MFQPSHYSGLSIWALLGPLDLQGFQHIENCGENLLWDKMGPSAPRGSRPKIGVKMRHAVVSGARGLASGYLFFRKELWRDNLSSEVRKDLVPSPLDLALHPI